jgi:hypothetical protein
VNKDSVKNLCVKISGLGALLICLPIIYRIWQGDQFNPASFFLWSGLSVVCTIVLWRAKKGGHVLLGCYVLSDLTIAICALLKQGQMTFGKFEWFVAGITIACTGLYLWCESRKKYTASVVSNGIACIIAGIPQAIDSLQNPEKANLVIVMLYTFISGLAYYGEKNFNGKFIPGLSVLYWIFITIGVLIARHSR